MILFNMMIAILSNVIIDNHTLPNPIPPIRPSVIINNTLLHQVKRWMVRKCYRLDTSRQCVRESKRAILCTGRLNTLNLVRIVTMRTYPSLTRVNLNDFSKRPGRRTQIIFLHYDNVTNSYIALGMPPLTNPL